ncbi:hypothetical protein WN55_10813 [Dufourea novaeangliae]|uniref:Uncharacterized protein n=1 Tax=Dufourea novaeangliae TaxID=178035 RepID=A0A154P9B0_DUFNO|nr:hypothetical protein WN55_10813 [Dufourea novaeangliae]
MVGAAQKASPTFVSHSERSAAIKKSKKGVGKERDRQALAPRQDSRRRRGLLNNSMYVR